jgi:hypothetical protein
VWLKPELSGILQEEWPYKVVAFEAKGRLQDLYPRIFPKHQEDNADADLPVTMRSAAE